MADNDTPEIPASVANRGAIGLTQLGAEQSKAKLMLLGDEGITPVQRAAAKAKTAAAISAEKRAMKYTGGTPCRGLTPDQIETITNRDYADAPKMGFMGDRSPAFVNWIWAKHPWDAKVRYATRVIWPSVLPSTWPPATPADAIPQSAATSASGQPKQYTAEEAALIIAGHRPRTYSQAEVDQMIADAKAGKSTPVDSVPAPKKPLLTAAQIAAGKVAVKRKARRYEPASASPPPAPPPLAPKRTPRKRITVPPATTSAS